MFFFIEFSHRSKREENNIMTDIRQFVMIYRKNESYQQMFEFSIIASDDFEKKRGKRKKINQHNNLKLFLVFVDILNNDNRLTEVRGGIRNVLI